MLKNYLVWVTGEVALTPSPLPKGEGVLKNYLVWVTCEVALTPSPLPEG